MKEVFQAYTLILCKIMMLRVFFCMPTTKLSGAKHRCRSEPWVEVGGWGTPDPPPLSEDIEVCNC